MDGHLNLKGSTFFLYTLYSVSQKRLLFQIQISALIQTIYCSSLNDEYAVERRIRTNAQFYAHGT